MRFTEGGLAGAPPSPDFSPTNPTWSGTAPLGRRHDDPPTRKLSEVTSLVTFTGTSLARKTWSVQLVGRCRWAEQGPLPGRIVAGHVTLEPS